MNRLWRDGQIVESGFDEAGWFEGEGVFETIRVEGRKIFAMDRHMRRALRAAREFGISLPSEQVIFSGISDVLSENPLELARMRLFFSRGHFAISYSEYHDSDGCIRVLCEAPTDAVISFKTYPYRHRLDLLEQATQSGCDEILLCNTSGEITEGAVSSFFFRDKSGWFTTPLSSGVLPGVMRALYLDTLDISVRPLLFSELSSITNALAVSSLRLAQCVAQIGPHIYTYDDDTKQLAEKMHKVAQNSSVLLPHG